MQMIEVIPNWHPVFVHFTVALISVATFFYCVGFFLHNKRLGKEMLITGRWCLWTGTLAAIATIAAGFIAYYTVDHDTPSHNAMVVHRNWALTTFGVIGVVFIWSLISYLKNTAVRLWFCFGMILTSILVLITAWHGAELVYRYGLGVLSLPKTEQINHSHSHKTKQEKYSKPVLNHSSHAH